jgi:hypothetical protein
MVQKKLPMGNALCPEVLSYTDLPQGLQFLPIVWVIFLIIL